LPLFAYTALAENGATLNGEGVAVSEEALRSELCGRGLLVRQVRPKRAALGLGLPARRVRPEEFALFNQEFMALVRAGLTVPDALALAAQRPDSPRLAKLLERVREDVAGGLALSEACARHPEAFEPLYLAAVRTGEKTGDFAGVLARYQDYLRHRVALRKKVGQALAYPVFLLVALAVILSVLFLFVLPRFTAMYADMGATLPFATRVLISVVEHLIELSVALVGGSAIAIWGWRSWVAAEAGQRQRDKLRERLPYFGELTRLATAAQLARSLSTLLAGGTPLVEALHTAASSIANRLYLDRLAAATRLVTEGSSLAQAVRATALMPPMAARLVEVGEASGSLDAMLAEVAQFYEEMLDNRLARVMTLIEPLLMLLMGSLIGAIIIVMYLPVFRLADIIK
jgi:type IV pilus assembly protein PilC